jgi:hypothetical protein
MLLNTPQQLHVEVEHLPNGSAQEASKDQLWEFLEVHSVSSINSLSSTVTTTKSVQYVTGEDSNVFHSGRIGGGSSGDVYRVNHGNRRKTEYMV